MDSYRNSASAKFPLRRNGKRDSTGVSPRSCNIENVSYKLKAVFSKTGDMRFISHLDLMRLFHRALRRADLPVIITKGFSPRIKMSIMKALKLGVESKCEEAVFYMDEKLSPESFLARINVKLPDGVKVVSAEEMM